jgi:diaminohydroxyphosphoribosylaminopyrimidine deaminase / 5-amino-6-(5-phosphoribosylamino)uracil reductase
MKSDSDHHYMAQALQLAARGVYTSHPNPRVGCVIVKHNEIIGAGWHRRAGEAHAEINALAQTGDKARDATVYVTLEPCCHQGRTPPCTDSLVAAGVRRVVVAMPDPNPLVAGKGIDQLRAAGIHVDTGVCQLQAEMLNQGYIMRTTARRPYVRCKLAMTLDGRTATAAGESKWITSVEARKDVQRYRARSAAVMTGSGTILADDPLLTVRVDELRDIPQEIDVRELGQPWRIIIDSNLKTPVSSRIFDCDGHILLACATGNSDTQVQLESKGAVVKSFPQKNGRVDLASMLGCLAGMEINEVLLEAGPGLSGAMLQAGLIDEMIIYIAPRFLGDAARGLFTLPGLQTMAQTIAVDIIDMRAIGHDWRITARVYDSGEK